MNGIERVGYVSRYDRERFVVFQVAEGMNGLLQVRHSEKKIPSSFDDQWY
jgi:hypothetical protein